MQSNGLWCLNSVGAASRAAFRTYAGSTTNASAWVLATRSGVLRRPWHHRQSRPDRQRLLLPLQPLDQDPRRSDHQPPLDQAVPTPDQRQSPTVQPHPARGMGLRRDLHLRSSPRRGVPRLAPSLKSPPRPHRTQGQLTDHTCPQRLRTEHRRAHRRGLYAGVRRSCFRAKFKRPRRSRRAARGRGACGS